MTKLPWQHFETPNWRAVFNLFTRALEKQDKYTKGHSDRVERMAVLLGRALSRRDPALWNGLHREYLKLAARFHDIGKIFVAKSTLNSIAALTEKQREELGEHPADGAWLIEPVLPEEICQGIMHHHQRWDGQGYPKVQKNENGEPYGLRSLDIPPIARVIAICDAFDAMTTERSYNVGRVMTTTQAAQRILELAGTQFDPDYAKVFVEQVVPQL